MTDQIDFETTTRDHLAPLRKGLFRPTQDALDETVRLVAEHAQMWRDTDVAAAVAESREKRAKDAEAHEREIAELVSERNLLRGKVAVLTAERDTATARLTRSREALTADGYFTASQVGADIAPRITERLAAAAQQAAALRDERGVQEQALLTLNADHAQLASDLNDMSQRNEQLAAELTALRASLPEMDAAIRADERALEAKLARTPPAEVSREESAAAEPPAASATPAPAKPARTQPRTGKAATPAARTEPRE
jgi:chromosome segregation ATPase